MTKKVNNTVVIEQTAPSKCTDCGSIDELRPYGKNGTWVCFDCMMKDEKEGIKQFSKLFSGERDI